MCKNNDTCKYDIVEKEKVNKKWGNILIVVDGGIGLWKKKNGPVVQFINSIRVCLYANKSLIQRK